MIRRIPFDADRGKVDEGGGPQATKAMHVKIGDTVRLPGFPGLLKVEDISGALGVVRWSSSTGETIRGEVFLSQLQPADWYQGKEGYTTHVGEPVPPPFAEERWDPPADG